MSGAGAQSGHFIPGTHAHFHPHAVARVRIPRRDSNATVKLGPLD